MLQNWLSEPDCPILREDGQIPQEALINWVTKRFAAKDRRAAERLLARQKAETAPEHEVVHRKKAKVRPSRPVVPAQEILDEVQILLSKINRAATKTGNRAPHLRPYMRGDWKGVLDTALGIENQLALGPIQHGSIGRAGRLLAAWTAEGLVEASIIKSRLATVIKKLEGKKPSAESIRVARNKLQILVAELDRVRRCRPVVPP